MPGYERVTERKSLEQQLADSFSRGEKNAALAFELALAEQLDGLDAAPTLVRALEWADAQHGRDSTEALEVLLTLISEHGRRGRSAEARAALEDLVARPKPGSPEQRRALGMAGSYFASQGDWAAAHTYYSRAADGAGTDELPALLHALGRSELEQGELERAETTLRAAIALGSGAAAVDLSDALAMAGRIDDAREVLEQAYAKVDKRWAAECASRLGALLRATGQAALAEKHARDAVMSAEELVAGGSVPALFELAAVQAQLGKNADALKVLERALAVTEAAEPRDDYAWAQASLRVGAQLLYGFAGREAEAGPHLNRAMGALTRLATADSPECAEVLVHQAVLYVRKNELELAEGLAARAASLYERAYGPGNRLAAGPLNLLGAVRLARGDQSGGVAALERAVAAAAGSPEAAQLEKSLAAAKA